jgi:hypothetical protein
VKLDPVRRNARLAVPEVEEGNSGHNGAGADTHSRASHAHLFPSQRRLDGPALDSACGGWGRR